MQGTSRRGFPSIICAQRTGLAGWAVSKRVNAILPKVATLDLQSWKGFFSTQVDAKAVHRRTRRRD